MVRFFKHILILGILLGVSHLGSTPNEGLYVFTAEKIRQIIQDYFSSRFQESGLKYSVEWLKEIPEIRLFKNPDSVHVQCKDNGLPKGHEVLKVTFFHKHKPLRSLYVSTKIHVFQNVWVVKKTIHQDEPLSLEKLNLESRDISEIVGAPLTEEIDVKTLIARRTLSQGRVITWRDVREPYCVHKGDPVSVVVRKTNFVIRMQVQALQNGSKGDLIWVKNPMTHRRMRVKVLEPELAVLP